MTLHLFARRLAGTSLLAIAVVTSPTWWFSAVAFAAALSQGLSYEVKP